MNGKLYLCATPIGNLGDVSARCLEAFNNADLIAAEDTRRTLQLLNHFEISKPLTSYHEQMCIRDRACTAQKCIVPY